MTLSSAAVTVGFAAIVAAVAFPDVRTQERRLEAICSNGIIRLVRRIRVPGSTA